MAIEAIKALRIAMPVIDGINDFSMTPTAIIESDLSSTTAYLDGFFKGLRRKIIGVPKTVFGLNGVFPY